jgi:hypothetical protein
VVQLHRAREDFGVEPAGLILVGQATPRQAARFRDSMKIDLPLLADEDRRTYKLAGAKRANVTELLGAKVVAKGVRASLRSGVLQGRIIGDAAQLGGAMVVAAGGAVAWSHMSEDAADNATPAQIVDALRAA